MNEGFEYRERIGSEAVGLTVLAHLAARHRHTDEAGWRERIADGQVHLDGRMAASCDLLRAGQTLVWRRPPWEEPEVPLAFAVLYRDDQLLAVAKPRGLPSIPNGGYLTHTLLYCVRRHWPEATPMHRLGRGTSGIVLFARTAEARRHVAAAWREGRVEKDYRALVQGVPLEPAFTIDARIGLVPHPRLGHVHAVSTSGRDALTLVQRAVARVDGTSVVDVRIPTGRPHQIRIHLAAAGHPLVGDPVYVSGGGLAADPGLPGDPGYRLHAYRLALEHPITRRRVEVECAPPPPLAF